MWYTHTHIRTRTTPQAVLLNIIMRKFYLSQIKMPELEYSNFSWCVCKRIQEIGSSYMYWMLCIYGILAHEKKRLHECAAIISSLSTWFSYRQARNAKSKVVWKGSWKKQMVQRNIEACSPKAKPMDLPVFLSRTKFTSTISPYCNDSSLSSFFLCITQGMGSNPAVSVRGKIIYVIHGQRFTCEKIVITSPSVILKSRPPTYTYALSA